MNAQNHAVEICAKPFFPVIGLVTLRAARGEAAVVGAVSGHDRWDRWGAAVRPKCCCAAQRGVRARNTALVRPSAAATHLRSRRKTKTAVKPQTRRMIELMFRTSIEKTPADGLMM